MVTLSASSEAGAGLSRIFVSYLHSCDRFFHMERNKLRYLCVFACVRTHVCVDIYEMYNVAGLCVYAGGGWVFAGSETYELISIFGLMHFSNFRG